MDKLKLIRENAEQFKKHIQDMENQELQKREKENNNTVQNSNQENKKQTEIR